MASHEVEGHLDYEEVKEERDLYKEKYLQLLKKYEDMAVSCNKTDSDDDEESVEPPAKKQRVYALMEGFGNLPFELIDKVFSYLKPKETLNSMLVSKCWKYFIETRYLSKVMDKVVVKFDKIVEYNEGIMDLIAENVRNYKHVEGTFGVKVVNQSPFSAYASSLESVKIIYDYNSSQNIEPEDFLKLKKLMIEFLPCDNTHGCCECHYKRCLHEDIMNFIKVSSFPELTHLQMQVFDRHQVTFAELLAKFPKLKVLLLASQENEDTERWHKILEPYKNVENQPKLEAIYMDRIEENVLFGFKDSLTEVCINSWVDSELFIEILKNLEKLKSLSIYEFEADPDRTEPFPRHEKLQTLSVRDISDCEEFEELLLHLPSLHTLDIYATVKKDFVEFLATNMINFKKLVCYSASKLARKFYKDLKKKDIDHFINSGFEIQFETDLETSDGSYDEWQNLEETFYNKHFE